MKENVKIIFMEHAESEAEVRYGVYDSPFGPCVIGVMHGNVCQLSFLKSKNVRAAKKELKRTWPDAVLVQSDAEVKKYFIKIFQAKNIEAISIALKGTPFQVKVWKTLLAIPKGKTKTYAEVARAIGSPKAVRAVGNACGKNSIPYLIPCHRVLASNGKLGGYSGGLSLKKAMLAAERY